jgi:hypothetical protein
MLVFPEQPAITRDIFNPKIRFDPFPIPRIQTPTTRKYLHPEKTEAVFHWYQYIMFRIDFELEFASEETDDFLAKCDHLSTTPCYDEEIIPISEIGCRPEHMLHEPVCLVEIDIGEYLARQISDGNTFLIGYGHTLQFWHVVAVDYLTKQSERDRIGNPERKDPFQNIMIDRIEELPHIRSPDVRIRIPGKQDLRPLDRVDETFFLPTRPDIEDECPVIYRHEVFVEHTVHDPVSDARDGYLPLLVLGNDKRPICAVSV